MKYRFLSDFLIVFNGTRSKLRKGLGLGTRYGAHWPYGVLGAVPHLVRTEVSEVDSFAPPRGMLPDFTVLMTLS